MMFKQWKKLGIFLGITIITIFIISSSTEFCNIEKTICCLIKMKNKKIKENKEEYFFIFLIGGEEKEVKVEKEIYDSKKMCEKIRIKFEYHPFRCSNLIEKVQIYE